jgi:hypothetical protein
MGSNNHFHITIPVHQPNHKMNPNPIREIRDAMKDTVATEIIVYALLVDPRTHCMILPMVNQLTPKERTKLVSTVLLVLLKKGSSLYEKITKTIGHVVMTGMSLNRTVKTRLKRETSVTISEYIIREPDSRRSSHFLRDVVQLLSTGDKIKMINGLIHFSPLVLDDIQNRVNNFKWEESMIDKEFHSLTTNGAFVSNVYYCGRDGDMDGNLRTMNLFVPNKKRRKILKFNYKKGRWMMHKDDTVDFVVKTETPNFVRLKTMLLCTTRSPNAMATRQFLGRCVGEFLGNCSVSHERDVSTYRPIKKSRRS